MIRYRKKILVCIFIAIICSIVYSICPKSLCKRDEKKIEISMEDAEQIGRIAANKHYKDMNLAEIHSYDNDEELSQKAGEDGKRQWWVAEYGDSYGNVVSIIIKNGAIVHVEDEVESIHGKCIFSTDLLTSKQAVEIARKEGLLPGNPENNIDWTSGYNFKLSYGSLNGREEEQIMMEVIGISPNGNFAHVILDAETGVVLIKEEQVVDNEEYKWEIF